MGKKANANGFIAHKGRGLRGNIVSGSLFGVQEDAMVDEKCFRLTLRLDWRLTVSL